MTILALFEVGQHVRGNELPVFVIAVRVVGLEHPQAVADGDARRDHQEPAGEVAAVGPANGVEGLPGDQHRHHGGLAGAGGQLERQPRQAGIRLLVGALKVVEDRPTVTTALRRDLGQPDQRLHRFDLAEEGPEPAEVVAAPVLQEPRGLGRDLPGIGVGYLPPLVHPLPQAGNDGHRVVLLRFAGQALAFVEDHPALSGLFARGRDRRDELGGPAASNEAVGWLPVLVELPMPGRVLVGRVEDGLFEEVRHSGSVATGRHVS